MRNIGVLFLKEFWGYLGAPSFYILMALFLLITGYGFGWSSATYLESSLHGFLNFGSFFLLVIGPALAIRLFSEEEKMGTLELLFTAPLKNYEIVFGKYLAALAVYVLMLLLTLYYPLLLLFFGHPDPGPLVTGYLGLFLLGAVFLAIGLFTSSLTANQVVAFVVAAVLVLVFWFIGLTGPIGGTWYGPILQALSLSSYFPSFNRGVIDSNGIIYYLSLVAVFLFLTLRSLEFRRWR